MQHIRTHSALKMPPRRGIAMMLVLISLVMATIVTVAYLSSRDNSDMIGDNVVLAAEARWSAESALEQTLAIFETETDWRNEHNNGVLMNNVPIGDADVTVTLEDMTTGQPPNDDTTYVEATAVADASGVVHTEIVKVYVSPAGEQVADVDLSEFSIFAMEGIQILDNAIIGLWGTDPMALYQGGTKFGSLLSIAGGIQFGPGTLIKDGTVYSSPSASNLLVTNNSVDSIDQINLPDAIPALEPVEPPMSYQDTVDGTLGDLVIDAQTFTIYGDYIADNTQIANGSVINFDGDRVIVIRDDLTLDNDSRFVVNGHLDLIVWDDLNIVNSAIELLPGATMNLYVAGDIVLDHGYIGDELALTGTIPAGTLDNSGYASWISPDDLKVYGITPAKRTASVRLDTAVALQELTIVPIHETVDSSAFAVNGSINVEGNALIDSYDATQGAYGGSNITSKATVSTNSSAGGAVTVSNRAQIDGDVFTGAGSDPESVVQISASRVTGSMQALTTNITMPNHTVPQGMPPSAGDQTFTTDQTWSSDAAFDNFTFKGARLTVAKEITVLVTKSLVFEEGAELIIDPGASVTFYVDNDSIFDNALVNNDSSNPDALTVLNYDANDPGQLIVQNNAVTSGHFEFMNGVQIKSGTVYGSLITGGSAQVTDGAQVHLNVQVEPGSLTLTPMGLASFAGKDSSIWMVENTFDTAQDVTIYVPAESYSYDFTIPANSEAYFRSPAAHTAEHRLIYERDAIDRGTNVSTYMSDSRRVTVTLPPDEPVWTLDNNSVMKASMYSPFADLIISSASAVYGNAATESALLQDDGALFYPASSDQKLGYTNLSGPIYDGDGRLKADVLGLTSISLSGLLTLMADAEPVDSTPTTTARPVTVEIIDRIHRDDVTEWEEMADGSSSKLLLERLQALAAEIDKLAYSDFTGATLEEQQANRRELRELLAMATTELAAGNFMDANSALNDAMGRFDGGGTDTITDPAKQTTLYEEANLINLALRSM